MFEVNLPCQIVELTVRQDPCCNYPSRGTARAEILESHALTLIAIYNLLELTNWIEIATRADFERGIYSNGLAFRSSYLGRAHCPLLHPTALTVAVGPLHMYIGSVG